MLDGCKKDNGDRVFVYLKLRVIDSSWLRAVGTSIQLVKYNVLCNQ